MTEDQPLWEHAGRAAPHAARVMVSEPSGHRRRWANHGGLGPHHRRRL